MAMAEFTLHGRLAQDTVPIARWPLSLVRLMNARNWPWLILVPQRPQLRELHDMSAADHGRFMEEIVRASRILAALFRADKMNVAALGNVVPQLHVHVIARHTTDPAWPRPVWSMGPTPAAYAPDELTARAKKLRRAFASSSNS
jgi:diadenosine tetraphosphate (Ap4A) HIT family hydrolase